MTLSRPFRSLLLYVLFLTTCGIIANAQTKPGRDPNQPVDQEYTNKIREYTTAPYFNSPLTDYLPASPTCRLPSPFLATSRARPVSCRMRKTFTSTCGCWSAPARA